MLASLILSGWIMVTHAPGWSEPIITVNDLYVGLHYKSVQVTESDHIHQVWGDFTGMNRVGYKCYYPDGALIFPETMISNDVGAGLPTTSLVDGSDLAAIWRESAPAWYCVRNSDGSEVEPASLYVSDPYSIRPFVNADSDSLGRIHAAFETSAGVVYNVYEPGVGEVWRDTIPASHGVGRVLVDGARVHIVFKGTDWQLDYIQYDLNGNVVVPAVSLVEDLTWCSVQWTMAVDAVGNLYCLFKVARSYIYLSLFKIEGTTGNIQIYDKEIHDPDTGSKDQAILASATGDSLYLVWIEDDAGGEPKYIFFSIIDMNGEFVETPYPAYDYTDENPEQLSRLSVATNITGDVFAIWDAYFELEGGFYIVLGWFDHNWLGIEDESTTAEPPNITLTLSSNPFTDFLSIGIADSPQVQELLVYDITGRQVISLGSIDGDVFLWDGSDGEGNQLPSGTYLIRAETQGSMCAAKVVKLD